ATGANDDASTKVNQTPAMGDVFPELQTRIAATRRRNTHCLPDTSPLKPACLSKSPFSQIFASAIELSPGQESIHADKA
ncbi:MAG: hypothetical protein KBH71_08605, partial [Anaerolineae bacterium]|nr:hypothetical protein [Anaerolineae bacterium]